MFDEFLSNAAELRSKGERFVVALVVRYEPPISGKPGDKAIIQADGTMWGWIGGGCSQPVVVKEALKALEDGRPRLIRISPSADSQSEEGIVDYTMTCHSGGALDIYIEPILPKPQIVIIGRSLVAQTLATLGKAINYAITVIAPGAHREHFPDADVIRGELDLSQVKTAPPTFIVVSTQGEYDEEALEQALRLDAPYIAFVASKVKARKMFDYLREKGISAELLNRVKAPAGLDIRAVSPEEIAVSILAEIIQVSRGEARPIGEAKETAAEKKPRLAVVTTEARDPICGMLVDVSRAKYRSEYEGHTFYFCCAGCKQRFDGQPERYGIAPQV